MRKTLGKVANFLASLWDLILTVAIIGLVVIRIGPLLLGYSPVVCMSNSMAPTFYTGSLCYIDKNYDKDSIRVGDVIAFKLSDGSQVTHRVHSITEEGIVTKGDANEDVDISPISKDQIIGENVMQIPFVGNFFKGFPNMLLIGTLAFGLALKIFLDLLAKWLLEEEESHEKEKQEVVDTTNTSTSD